MELLYVSACAPNSYLNIFDKVQEVEHRIADPTLCVGWVENEMQILKKGSHKQPFKKLEEHDLFYH